MCPEIISMDEYKKLSLHCHQLEEENERLRELLTSHHISFQTVTEDEVTVCTEVSASQDEKKHPSEKHLQTLSKSSPLIERIQLFMSLFHGRDDVYALYWENKQKGTKGYRPACRTAWVPAICPLPQKKCS